MMRDHLGQEEFGRFHALGILECLEVGVAQHAVHAVTAMAVRRHGGILVPALEPSRHLVDLGCLGFFDLDGQGGYCGRDVSLREHSVGHLHRLGVMGGSSSGRTSCQLRCARRCCCSLKG